MEALNTQWFLWINGMESSSAWVTELARWCAEYLICFIGLLPFLMWLRWQPDNVRVFVRVVAALVLTGAINLFITQVYFHPRPFMLGLGHLRMAHPAETSFPSDHGTAAFTVACAFLLAKRWWLGITAFCAACVIAWARVYEGVHFPLDMVGAFGVALLSNGLVAIYDWIRPFRQPKAKLPRPQ